MQTNRVKGKWLSRLRFVKELFEHRIEAIERHIEWVRESGCSLAAFPSVHRTLVPVSMDKS